MKKFAMASAVFGILILNSIHTAGADEIENPVQGYSQGSIGVGLQKGTVGTEVNGSGSLLGGGIDIDTDGESLRLRQDLLIVRKGKYLIRSESEGKAVLGSMRTSFPATLLSAANVLESEDNRLSIKSQNALGVVSRSAWIGDACHGYAAISTSGEIERRQLSTSGIVMDFANQRFSAGPELGLACQMGKVGLMLGMGAEERVSKDDSMQGYDKEARMGLKARVNLDDRALLKVDANRGKKSGDFTAAVHVKAASDLPIYLGAEYQYEGVRKDFIGAPAGNGGLEFKTNTFSGVAGVAW
jgi:hypothetical protein